MRLNYSQKIVAWLDSSLRWNDGNFGSIYVIESEYLNCTRFTLQNSS